MIPALVYFLGVDQHTAQGTSLAVMLPPIGLFAAYNYYKAGQVYLVCCNYCSHIYDRRVFWLDDRFKITGESHEEDIRHIPSAYCTPFDFLKAGRGCRLIP